jgi:hypothetical protein
MCFFGSYEKNNSASARRGTRERGNKETRETGKLRTRQEGKRGKRNTGLGDLKMAAARLSNG